MLRRIFNKFAIGLPFLGLANVSGSTKQATKVLFTKDEQNLIKLLSLYTSKGYYPVFTGRKNGLYVFSYEANGILREFSTRFDEKIKADDINNYFGYPVFETATAISLIDSPLCSGFCYWRLIFSPSGKRFFTLVEDSECAFANQGHEEGCWCPYPEISVDELEYLPINTLVKVKCGKYSMPNGCGTGCHWKVDWVDPNNHFLGRDWKLFSNDCQKTNSCGFCKKPNVVVDNNLPDGFSTFTWCQAMPSVPTP